MTQAIVTKYLGPTGNKGGRIKAQAWSGSVIVPYSHGLSNPEAHALAAQALMQKQGWGGEWACGGMPDGSGDSYVFVNVKASDCAMVKPDA